MIRYTLTPDEELLIKEASKVQLDSLVTLHEHGHVDFEDFLNEYDEAEKDDIALEILEEVISFEDLATDPHKIWNLGKHALLAMQFIILKMLENGNEPIKKMLYWKLQQTIDTINATKLN